MSEIARNISCSWFKHAAPLGKRLISEAVDEVFVQHNKTWSRFLIHFSSCLRLAPASRTVKPSSRLPVAVVEITAPRHKSVTTRSGCGNAARASLPVIPCGQSKNAGTESTRTFRVSSNPIPIATTIFRVSTAAGNINGDHVQQLLAWLKLIQKK